ncbi:MAG: phosphoribosylglycinamide formyltransferase 1, partial [Nitrospirota bacterium]|nr:phosphoribosylglycinamide formyltransferase 1 [Nitrospirota bacterium]
MSGKSPRLVRLGVLVSGRGSNLQAIIDAIEAGTLSAEVAVVLSNKQNAGGLERARKHGAPAVWLDPKPYAGRPDSREAFDKAVLEVLQKHEVDLVLLAGYMKIVTAVLVSAYENRMMNIHP